MTTNKIRIQGYLSTWIFDALETYRGEQELTQSAAIEQILADFFRESAPQAERLATESGQAEEIQRLEGIINMCLRAQADYDKRLEILESRILSESPSASPSESPSASPAKYPMPLDKICPVCKLSGISGEYWESDDETLLSCGNCGWNDWYLGKVHCDSPSESPDELPALNDLEAISESPDELPGELRDELPSELLSELPGDSPDELPDELPFLQLSNVLLAKRLKCNVNTLRGKKSDPTALSWTWRKDPEGLSWRWNTPENCWEGRSPTAWIELERGKL